MEQADSLDTFLASDMLLDALDDNRDDDWLMELFPGTATDPQPALFSSELDSPGTATMESFQTFLDKDKDLAFDLPVKHYAISKTIPSSSFAWTAELPGYLDLKPEPDMDSGPNSSSAQWPQEMQSPGAMASHGSGGSHQSGNDVVQVPASAKGSKAAKKEASDANTSRYKRTRLRQKERMSALEQEVAQKLAQLELLSAENDKLKLRAEVLERVVTVRDKQLKTLNEHGPPICPLHGVPAPAEQDGEQPAGVPDSKECLAHLEVSKLVQVVKRMSPDDIKLRWKQFIRNVSGPLLELETRPGDAALLEQITSIVRQTGYVCRHVALLNPALMTRFSNLNMENNTVQSGDDEQWQQVLEVLNLSAQQRRLMHGMFEIYARELQKVFKDRREVRAEWSTMNNRCSSKACEAQAASLASICPNVQAALLDRLMVNLKKEYQCCVLLNGMFFDQILDSVQFAKCAVYSYPYFPNVLALFGLVAGTAAPGAALPTSSPSPAVTTPFVFGVAAASPTPPSGNGEANGHVNGHNGLSNGIKIESSAVDALSAMGAFALPPVQLAAGLQAR